MLPDFGLFAPRSGVGARSYTSAVGNGNRNKRKKPGGQKAAPATTGRTSRPLAWHQFQELNFSFDEEQPSDFINMRVELLSLMLCNEEHLHLRMPRNDLSRPCSSAVQARPMRKSGIGICRRKR